MKDLASQIQAIMTSPTSSDEKTEKTNIFRELYNGDLPAEEKTLPRLRDEGQTMIAAGQETSSFFLQQASYFILADPAIHARLKAELEVAIPNPAIIPPLAKLEQLPYLHAVVQEVHRFAHGVVGRLERISPETPIKYKDWTIPPGTPVAMTSLLQHRDASIFPDPMRFDPERWLPQPQSSSNESGGERLDKYLVPFSKGTRQCLGINLATAEIYLTIAMVWRRFEMELFDTTGRDAEVVADYFIPGGHEDSKGVRIVFK